MSEDFRPTVVERAPVALQTHGLGVKFLFAEHGLSPYRGLVRVFEPDHEDMLDAFDAVGETWEIVQSDVWHGQLAPPDGDDYGDGMYEYQYQLVAEDAVGDKDCTLQLRPGFPDAENYYSGEPIQGMPDDCPESLRVQLMSTNLDTDEVLPLLRAFAEHIGLNPDYFLDPHAYSSAYQLERYGRLDREVAEAHLTGDGGVLDRIASFGSGQNGRGMYKWDHEDVQAHYEAVGLDPDTWALLIPDQTLGKQLKCYHPQHVRDADSEDVLADPKIEISLSSEYDPEGTVPWSSIKDAVADLDAAAYNALHWADVPLAPGDDAWNGDDPYFDADAVGNEVTLHADPLDDLREATETVVESELVSRDISAADQDLILALTDGGETHYEQLADDADRSTSAVYRLLDKLSTILDSDNGIVQFADEVTRDYVADIVEPLRETADWASEALRDAVEREGILSGGEPSALERWMSRHGFDLVNAGTRLHLRLDRPVSRRELAKILRAGLEAAEASGLESDYRDALIDWHERGEGSRYRWRVYNEGLPLGLGDRSLGVSYTR